MNQPARLLSLIALAVAPLLLALPPPAAAHTRAELEQMLAPIALYPDSVLSHILIAATYPEEVAEAARWSRRNSDLHGEAAVNAVDRRDWDPSVKALVAFPEILARMDEDPDWTEDLGDAFLEHEAEVMDSVQLLRDHAYDAGHLRNTEHVRVIREREYIYIEPAVHHVIYVPYYDPWYVYGSWWWPHHPPYRWRHWHGHTASYYGTGFYWGVGFRIAPTFYFTSFYWPERYVVVTHYRAPSYRPLYSGRHVTRQPEVRHWRGTRPDTAQTRYPRGDSRADRPQSQRGPGAAGRPDEHPGRGPETRRPREDRDEGRGRGWRSTPEREQLRDDAERGPRRDEREARRDEREAQREDAPGQRRRVYRSEEAQPERADRPERDQRPERGQRPERAERPERPERPERSQRPEREERGAATDRERPVSRGEARERAEEPRRESRGNGHEQREDDRGRGRDAARGKRDEREEREERKQNGRERSQRDR